MRTPERILRQSLPTDGLEAAIEAFRYPAPARRAASWPALAGLLTALAVGGTVLRLSAPAAEASPLARIARALESAPRTMMHSESFVEGIWKDQGSTFWQEGAKRKYRIKDPWIDMERAFDGVRVWEVQHQSGFAKIATGKPEGFGGSRYDDFGPTLHLYEVSGWSQRRADLGQGRTVLTFEKGRKARSTLVIETATSRPLVWTHELPGSKGWRPDNRIVWEYPDVLPSGLFDFRPPKSYEVYDVDANGARLVQGLRNGPAKSVGGATVRLIGALQARSGRVTAVYTGGATPMPDAIAGAEREGSSFAGSTIVASPDAPRPAWARAASASVIPSDNKRPIWTVIDAPYGTLEGVPIRMVSFDLPKVAENRVRALRITLPVIVRGSFRTVASDSVLIRGDGHLIGTVTFEGVLPIRSNQNEEVDGLPTALVNGLRIDLVPTRKGKTP